LTTGGQGQHIFDLDTFRAFGYQESDIMAVEDTVLDQLPMLGELTRIIQDDAGQVYWVVDGERWAVERWAETLQALDPSPVDAALLADLPLTRQVEDLPPGTLLTSDNFGYYYLVDDGLIRRIPNDLLPAYGLTEAAAVTVPDPVLLAYRGGLPLAAFLQVEDTDRLYRLQDGQRQPVASREIIFTEGYGVEDISQVPVSFIEQFPLEPSSTVLTCTEPPADFIADRWQSDSGLANQLGCPQSPLQMTGSAWQPFEQGDILWRQDLNLIYVLPDGGSWQVYGDTWRDGDLQFDTAITAPDGLYQPVRGFGKVWREEAGVRESLGWGTQEESGGTAQVQQFEDGFAIRLPVEVEAAVAPPALFIIFKDGTFQ
jgi:hypothetical protein